MALLDIRRHFRLERVPFQPFPPHIDPALHDLSGDLVRHDSPSGTITFYWHLPNGPCDNCQHACVRLRSRMGPLGYLPRKCGTIVLTCKPRFLTALGLGIVVGGRCGLCLYMLLSSVCDVSSSTKNFPHSCIHSRKTVQPVDPFTTVCISTKRSSPR